MKQTKISMNLSGLEDIAKKVGGTYRTRIGVLGSQTHQNEGLRERKGKPYLVNRAQGETITNAELLLIMMFGSLTKNIPARDPLVEPLINHRRELTQKLGKGSMRAAFEGGDYLRMFTLLGIAAEEIVQTAFETSGDGSWAPNAQSTIDAKGSSKPLINTSQLRAAISSDVVAQSGSETQNSLQAE